MTDNFHRLKKINFIWVFIPWFHWLPLLCLPFVLFLYLSGIKVYIKKRMAFNSWFWVLASRLQSVQIIYSQWVTVAVKCRSYLLLGFWWELELFQSLSNACHMVVSQQLAYAFYNFHQGIWRCQEMSTLNIIINHKLTIIFFTRIKASHTHDSSLWEWMFIYVI